MTAPFELSGAVPLTVEMARHVVEAAIHSGQAAGSGEPLYRESTLASWTVLFEQSRAEFWDLFACLPAADRGTLRQALRAANEDGSRAGGSAPRLFRVRTLEELRVKRSGSYWIKDLFPSPGLSLVYGASGCGKTFLLGHAAFCASAGAEFFGRRVTAGPVAYIAAENPASVEMRFAAWRDQPGAGVPRLYVVDGPISLADQDAMAALLERLRGLALETGGLRAIIVDTAAAAAPGIDENASADMGKVIRACAMLRDEFGAAVILVHHGGKDASRGARGHSSLRAAVDAEVEVELLSGGGRRAKVTKSRDGSTGGDIHFELDALEIGTDEDGDPLTTCRVTESTAASVPKTSSTTQRLTPAAAIALEALRELTEQRGERAAGTSVIPSGVLTINMDDWRNRYRAREGRLSEDAALAARERELTRTKIAFRRATLLLHERHIVGIWESLAWLR